MKTILITGAGGFIGGHLASDLSKKNNVICVDVKPFKDWFQIFNKNKNYSLDLKNYKNCEKIIDGVDYVYNLACDMGGMGFIENNKSECMTSVLINTNLLLAAKKKFVSKFFFSSSACVYNLNKQKKSNIKGLKETDAYPADPEDGYGWEKLFSERMCRHFMEDYGIDVRIARYHNVYGPLGTYDGGREKAPAALCRKIILAKLNGHKSIDIWGNGRQTRSFMHIEDCILGTKKIFNSNFSQPLNLGSSEQVTINKIVDIIEEIAQIKLKRKYLLNMPKGVNGRSSDNNLIRKKLNWCPEITLKAGLESTYKWIYDAIKHGGKFNSKFQKP